MTEKEKKAIELLEDIKNNSWTTKYIMSSDSKNADILLNLITKLQKENEEKDRYIKNKDKQIDLMAFSLADYVMYYEYDKCRNPEMIKQKAKELKQYFETKAKEGE